MDAQITIFLPCGQPDTLKQSIDEFRSSGMPVAVVVIETPGHVASLDEDVSRIQTTHFFSTETIRKIAGKLHTPYAVLINKSTPVKPGANALHRFLQVAKNTGAGMIYSDYHAYIEGSRKTYPVIEYQEGSLRDDFNFGSLLFYNAAALKAAAERMSQNFLYAGWYDLRLKVSESHSIFHIPEYLYTETETDTRKSGEKQFDYVNPRNREVQIEMEQACTEHLKNCSAYLAPEFTKLQFDEGAFPVEASVVIPVKNRSKTISDAIHSVLSQKADFLFNLIIVDNHSTDGTSDLIRNFAERDSRIIHIIPERDDLGIGGCWNEAVFHASCGKFAVQLDSDDLYSHDQVLNQIVHAFYDQQCAMLIGSYRMVNFKLEEIPPGIIDHREWTPENGRNNALRINGLGAPRAFYTPVLRDIRFPNVSYGEDYMLGLTISRNYQIGRIYEPLYLCRRWEENSDAELDIQKLNSYNFYKDKIRTMELQARKIMISGRKNS